MFEFLTANFATIIIGVAVILLLSVVIRKMIRDKKNNKSSCGCACANCPSSNICHTK